VVVHCTSLHHLSMKTASQFAHATDLDQHFVGTLGHEVGKDADDGTEGSGASTLIEVVVGAS